MPTFSDNNITFIHIPKTAGASITLWYLKNILKMNRDLIKENNHIFASEIQNPSPVTFTVIRNPWDRIVSIYMFMKYTMHEVILTDFYDFVLDKIKFMRLGVHKISTPQIRWIEPGVTHLLRFENLEKDFKIIQDINNDTVTSRSTKRVTLTIC